MKRIGVLALQGAFAEHISALVRLGIDAREVRLPAELAGLDGLIIPGGESTTVGKLMVDYRLLAPIADLAQSDFPIWGTCAGMIVLAKRIDGQRQPLIGVMDITVQRNAFGRQVDSFETEVDVKGFDSPFHAVFIRAPKILEVGEQAQTLATLQDGSIIAVSQGKLLATSFHPELTDDTRIHELFVESA